MKAKTARPAEQAAAATQVAQAASAAADDPPMSARDDAIRIAAYARAEARGFVPGHELEDWLAAEREVDTEQGVA